MPSGISFERLVFYVGFFQKKIPLSFFQLKKTKFIYHAKRQYLCSDRENIFPIIKKFLYSDQEIFLRELISNAIDATSKIKSLSSRGEYKGELGDLTLEIILDKEAKTLTIKDKGLGMSEEEVGKYLNQIAISSAQEFVEKYKDEANIIGKFGLGFYSAFMVADKVEVNTKSWQEEEKAVLWTCEGNPDFTIKRSKKKDRGTDIILHISDDSSEFLERRPH